jgi:Ca2+-binding EF-hand superfamily protein
MARETKTGRMLTLTQAARQLTFRRAALVAISSMQQSMTATEDVNKFVKLNKQLMRLQTACMGAEMEFFKALTLLDRKDKQSIVMKLIDRDGDGKINLREMAIAYHKMDATKAYAKCVEDADQSIQNVDEDKDGMMNREEFGSFMLSLVDNLKCTFDELCFVLVQWIAFNVTGDDIVQEALEDNAVNADQQDEYLSDFEDEVTETRIALLFQYLDYNGSGKLLFIDVFERLIEVVKTMNEKTRDVLFMMDGKQDRKLDYHEFTNLLYNVTAACPPGTHFHDIADAMTVAGASDDKVHAVEISNLLAAVELDRAFVQNKVPKELHMTPLSYGRVQNLFRMSDTDTAGFVEVHELIMSIRKLQGTSKDIDEAIEDTVALIAHVDKKHDQRVDLREYAFFISALASALNTDVNELVSYLAVELALRDNDEKEKAYVIRMKKNVS